MKTITKRGKDLSKKEIEFIAKANVKNFEDIKDVQKQVRLLKKEEPKSIVFFVKKDNKIVSLGLLRPIRIKYLGKNYNIFGISNIISIIKRKGYGKILVQSMKDFLSKKGKTGLGFCSERNKRFYKKSGITVEGKLKNRFFYDYGNPKKNKEEMNDSGIYYEGKDKLISKVLKTKSLVKIPCEHW